MAKADKTICTFERCRTQNTRLRVSVLYEFANGDAVEKTHFDVKPGERIEVRLRQNEAIRLEELED